MDNIANNKKLVQRFCKDVGIPININEMPYFNERLEILNKIMSEKKWKDKWNDFCNMLKDFKNEEEYFEYYNNVKDTAITAIKSSQGFQRFNNEDMNNYKNHIKETHPNLYKEIYNEDAIGKKFISFDLMSANFNALRHYDSLIFNNKITWEQFLFLNINCSYNYILDSKYIRQVVLGNCNPGRQITYTGWLAEQILDIIEKEIPGIKLVNFTTDELIFEAVENGQEEIDILLRKIESKINVPVKAETFILRKIEGELNGYLKDIYDYDFKNKVRIEYKGINGDFAFLTIWLLDRYKSSDDAKVDPLLEDFEDNFVFNYNGHLAKLLDVPKFSVKCGK